MLLNNEIRLTFTELCYQYRYGWIVPMSISYIHAKREQYGSTYFCINYPANARATLTAMLSSIPDQAHQEFLVDFLAADESLKQWQHDIGSRRKDLIAKVRRASKPSETQQLTIPQGNNIQEHESPSHRRGMAKRHRIR
jgi:hypothetical protein